jgi:hypothetical protein
MLLLHAFEGFQVACAAFLNQAICGKFKPCDFIEHFADFAQWQSADPRVNVRPVFL